MSPSNRSVDAITDILAQRVLSGELPPESRLPSERQLATEFGVSRPVIREALRSLVERGLISIEPSRGAYVRDDTGPRRFPPLDLEYRRRGTTARQLSEARLALETGAVAFAALHADADDLTRIEQALEIVEQSPNPLERVRNDLSFHIALVSAAHNPVIETMFASIHVLTVELMVRSASDENIIKLSEPYHRIVFEAIRDRDPEAAREAMRAHLSVAASTYGDDYDRSLDTAAAASLRLVGSGVTLDEFISAVPLTVD